MRNSDVQLGLPNVMYTGAQAAVEGLAGVVEGSTAYATDLDQPGWYDGAAWVWGSIGGYVWQTFMFSMEGDLTTGAKPLRIYMPVAYTIDKVFIAVNTAPLNQAVVIDVEKDGVTIFTDQGKRPSIAAAAYTDESDTPDVTALIAGSYLTYSIDQIGTGTVGADLTVHVRCTQEIQS